MREVTRIKLDELEKKKEFWFKFAIVCGVLATLCKVAAVFVR